MTLPAVEQQMTPIPTSGDVYLKGDIGGLEKRRYYTPDGEEIFRIPGWRTFNRIQVIDGKRTVVESGTRDANLDKGWLLEFPKELKPHCNYCGKWHDTQGEIEECGKKKKAFDDKWAEKARKMNKPNNEVEGIKAEVDGLKSDMSEIKDLLTKLLER